jgi:hypothetical protein
VRSGNQVACHHVILNIICVRADASHGGGLLRQLRQATRLGDARYRRYPGCRGHQQLSMFNAHYDERCFLPIHVYYTATSTRLPE